MRNLAITPLLTLALALAARRFEVRASTTKEGPPLIGVIAGGTASLDSVMSRDADGQLTQTIIDRHVRYQADEPQQVVAMHTHRGAEGTSGPVVINSGLRPGPHQLHSTQM